MKSCFLLLPKAINTHWREGEGASGREEDKGAENGRKIFQTNIGKGMVLRALVEGLTSSWIWRRYFRLYLLMILDEAVVTFSVIWTHTVLKAHIILVWVVHYLTVRRVGCVSQSCY